MRWKSTSVAAMLAALTLFGGAAVANAEPGVGDPVYAATVEKGVAEFEARYGRLNGGEADGEDGLVLEAEYGFSSRFKGAVLTELAREAGRGRRVESISVEGVYTLGRVKALALDTAIYGEYKVGLNGNPDEVELKGLFQHRAGNFDGRLNLIVEKPLTTGAPVEFGYAASADWALIGDEVKLGIEAFGETGSSSRFFGANEHFIGPIAKFEIEHVAGGEIEIETGWLRAFGASREEADGQARLLISFERHF